MGGCTVKRVSIVIEFQSTQRLKHHLSASQMNKLMVIAFSTWNGPSQYLNQIFNAIAAKYGDVDCIKIDLDKMADAAQQFGIQTMPTFLLMKNGNEVDKLVGSDQEELERKIQKHRL